MAGTIAECFCNHNRKDLQLQCSRAGRFSIATANGYSHGKSSVGGNYVRFAIFMSLTLLTACASMPERDIKIVHRHESASEQCRSLDRVQVKAVRRWWHGLAGPQSYERLARQRLMRAADRAGGNSVRVTAYRAFKAETGGGLRRVEIEGRVLDCPAGS
jgi:hypothetical protein